MTTTEPATRRSDATRNRQLVLAAATDAFAERGPEVLLTEIAGRAGVGVGTVYRHFPTKESLFSAVLSERISAFTRAARGLPDRVEPGAAFFCFLFCAIENAVVNAGLCADLEGRIDYASTEHQVSKAEYRALLARLLAGAQRVGVIRADVSAAEVSALICGCVAAIRQLGAIDQPARLATLACTGLLADRSADLPDWTTVTKLMPPAEPSHETEPASCHETGVDSGHETRTTAACAQCGKPIRTASTGRPARYCGPTCRQRAHRSR